MVFGKILIEKLKAEGLSEAEVVVMKVFKAAKETVAEAAVHPEAEAAEKIVCSVAAPVVAGLEESVAKAVDFNGNGQVG